MAYGNWGAFVHRNGKRMTNYEDQTPYKEDERESGYWQAFGFGDKDLNAHHAVLGTGRLRLCGYKCYPRLYLDGKSVDLSKYGEGEPDEYGEFRDYSGTIEGHEFSAAVGDNSVYLHLKTPEGDQWTAECGFEMGAGFE